MLYLNDNTNTAKESASLDIIVKKLMNMQKKVFISFVEEDLKIAQVIKDRLSREGISAWIYTEDNGIGDYREGIMQAIADSKIMILVFSRHTEKSPHISKELREASAKNLIIIPFFVENIEEIKNESIRYEIQHLNWLQGWKPPHEEQISILIQKTKSILDPENITPKPPSAPVPPEEIPNPSLGWLKIILGAIFISLVMGGIWYYFQGSLKSDTKDFNQENITRFLTDYLTVGEQNAPDKFLNYYASLVEPYFSKEQATRKEILKDKINYIKRWPQRKYELKGFSIIDKEIDYCTISFSIDWRVQSDTLGARSGESSSVITIKQKGGRFYIVSMEEIPTEHNVTSAKILKNIQKCEKDDAGACTAIGITYTDNKQYEEAFPYFKKGCDLSSDGGCSWLGWSYYTGNGISKDYTKAVKSYAKIKGKLGTSPLNNLAWMHQHGKGTKQDIDLAIQYYQKSADLNNTFAIKEVSKLRKKQEAEMIENLQKCEKNDVWACNALAKSYDKNKQYIKAFPYFKKSCELGSSWGCRSVGWAYFYGKGTNINYEKAMESYSKIEGKWFNDIGLYNNIAWMYRKGRGIEQNFDKAIEYYQKSIDLNSTTAIKALRETRYKKYEDL